MRKKRTYEIVKVLSIFEKDSLYINELHLKKIHSSFDTKKLMYDKFGKWDKEVWPKNVRYPIFIWENIKLLNKEEALFSIVATGIENINEYYASVMVYDSDNHDCFTENAHFRESLILYFLHGIRNLDKDKPYTSELLKSLNQQH